MDLVAAATSLPIDGESLAALGARIDARRTVREDSLGELRRQYRAASKRRGGPGSADAAKYRLGSVLVLVGAGGTDDTALLGLLAHPEQMSRWMDEARNAGAGPQFGDVVTAIFADPDRHDWCRQWGRILQWRYRKPLYDAAVADFVASGRTGPEEPWRQKAMTDDQAELVATLVGLLSIVPPKLATRGEAFDWIWLHGGNPIYWREPTPPSDGIEA